jgi:methylmalonyl-CoA/ethylmalonyl-CoA epimerase
VLDHIAIATRDATAMRKLYELIGFEVHKVEEVPSQKVVATFLELHGVHVELLEPTSDDSAVAKAIAKRGEGLHHLAFKVPSLAEAMQRLRAQGYGFIYDEPQPGAGGKKINFIHPRDGGGVLVELCE